MEWFVVLVVIAVCVALGTVVLLLVNKPTRTTRYNGISGSDGSPLGETYLISTAGSETTHHSSHDGGCSAHDGFSDGGGHAGSDSGGGDSGGDCGGGDGGGGGD